MAASPAPRLPDFVVGGAPRSGTTWLHSLLDRHPRVRMARPARPEPKFFLVDEVYAKGLGHYAATWFRDVPDGSLAGEKSSNYLESAAAAERIRECLPGARMVFVLREPAERAWSNWRWSRKNGMEDEEDFARSLDLEARRERECPAHLRFSRPHAYYSRGLYADLLGPWFERFHRDRVLCLAFDDVVRTPRDVAARVHRFLGLEERPGDADGLPAENAAGGEEGGPPIDDAMRRLREAYAGPNRRLAALLGPGFAPWEGMR